LVSFWLGAALAAFALRTTAAAAAVVSTVTRARLCCLGRRWDATEDELLLVSE
jgi:hypothetical protein